MNRRAAAFEREFTRLFREQSPVLLRYVNRLAGDPELAADIVQETFVKLYQRGDLPDDARAWLVTVALNLVRDERRTASRRDLLLERHAPHETAAGPPDLELLEEEQRQSVRVALLELAERDREMLLLKHAGYSYREIATVLDLAEASIGTMLARATASFHAAFSARNTVPER
jgi:RNA polymerase sigma-70 factor (ECF subfamily)